MKLRFVGPAALDGAALPLPEGWPAADHEESDRATAQAKLDSKHYRRAAGNTSTEGAP